MLAQVLTEILTKAGDIRALARRLENPRFYAAWTAVLLLHVAAIWILAANLAVLGRTKETGAELQITLTAIGSPAPAKIDPVPDPQMQATDTSDAPAPNFEIQGPVSATDIAVSPAAILPPRPDPSSHNVNPTLPAAFAQFTTPVQVMLTILVASDGRVSDVRVAQSSGQSVLDTLAETFTKANWRFRAATQNGKPVADWTTVLVRFASAD